MPLVGSAFIPLKEMNFTLNKREFRDAIKLRYGWEFNDIPTVCVCGDLFDADHAMICMRGGYIIQRHNEIRDLEAEILQAVCTDVEMEPVLQEVTGEVLPRGANKAPDARLDIRAQGFWVREQSAFFDVRVYHPNVDSYKNLTTEQIYKLHENDKKRLYSSRVLEVERGTFTPLVFTTTGGMSNECQRYHSRLAKLLVVMRQENYASTIAWIRTRVSFAILRSALVCLRGSRLGLSRLCSATFEQLLTFGATFCGFSNLEQVLPFRAIFEQNIGLEHISSTKKSTISWKTSIHANFLKAYHVINFLNT